jgi:hypothetical protein
MQSMTTEHDDDAAGAPPAGGMWKPKQLARFAGVTTRSVRRWGDAGRLGVVVHLSARSVRYHDDAVRRFLHAEGIDVPSAGTGYDPDAP